MAFLALVAGFGALTVGLAIDVKENGPQVPPQLEADYRQVGSEVQVDWALLAAWDGVEFGFALPVQSIEEVFAEVRERELRGRREAAERRCAQNPGDPALCPPPQQSLSPEEQDGLWRVAYGIWHASVVQHIRGHAAAVTSRSAEAREPPEALFQHLLPGGQAGRAAELYEAYLILDQLDQDDDHLSEGAAEGPPPDWRPVDGFAWPASGPITSRYGWRTSPIDGVRRLHAGIDIALATGEPVRVAKDGVIVRAESDPTYGQVVEVDHGEQYTSLYAHNSRLLVAPGGRVHQGQVLALAGSTGKATGPHVHFEIHFRGAPVDPLLLLGR